MPVNNIVIEILPDGPRPNPAPVQQGDIVTFQLSDLVQGKFTVSFDSAGCFFDSDPFTLQSGSLLTSERTHSVVATAVKGGYPYSIVPDEETRARYTDWETKRGDLDVTTDPPPPPKDKEKKPKKDK